MEMQLLRVTEQYSTLQAPKRFLIGHCGEQDTELDGPLCHPAELIFPRSGLKAHGGATSLNLNASQSLQCLDGRFPGNFMSLAWKKAWGISVIK